MSEVSSGRPSGHDGLPPALREFYARHFPPPVAADALAALMLGRITPEPEVARALALSRPFAPLLALVSALEQLRQLPVDRPLYRRLLQAAFDDFLAAFKEESP